MKRSLAVTLLLALAICAPAQAASPTPGKRYMVHDHDTPGDAWHVEVRANRDGDAVSVVVHSDRCGGRTPFARHVPVGDTGVAKTYRDLVPGKPGKGRWSFESRFTESHRLDGTFSITTPSCNSGPMVFVAHSGGHVHTATGPLFPDVAAAEPQAVREAAWLYQRTLAFGERRFGTYRAALARGYRAMGTPRRPSIFHLRKDSLESDDHYLHPKRPEALVAYMPRRGKARVLGTMYRYKAGPPPAFGKGLLSWHTHGNGKRNGLANQMTHVWYTGDLRSALANCTPVEQLEAYMRTRVRFPEQDLTAIAPCPAGA